MSKGKKPTAPLSGAGSLAPMSTTVPCPLVGNDVVSDAFKSEFKKIVGMSLEDSIKLYKNQTGEELTADKVQKLFKDSSYAKKQLMANKNLHTIYRDILNTNIPPTEKEAKARGFTKLPFIKSLYHDPFHNSKYVDSSGHLESVYDGQGNLVTSKDYLGTFNFFDPNGDSLMPWGERPHIAADVDPYNKWGN